MMHGLGDDIAKVEAAIKEEYGNLPPYWCPIIQAKELLAQ